RREPTVIGRQVDVQAGDVTPIALGLPGRRADLGLLERDRITPVAERDAPVDAGPLCGAVDRQPADSSARETPGRALPARRRVGVARDARRRDLTAEERQRADRARGD